MCKEILTQTRIEESCPPGGEAPRLGGREDRADRLLHSRWANHLQECSPEGVIKFISQAGLQIHVCVHTFP